MDRITWYLLSLWHQSWNILSKTGHNLPSARIRILHDSLPEPRLLRLLHQLHHPAMYFEDLLIHHFQVELSRLRKLDLPIKKKITYSSYLNYGPTVNVPEINSVTPVTELTTLTVTPTRFPGLIFATADPGITAPEN